MTQEATEPPEPPKQQNAPSVARTFGLVAVLTVLSKIAGLARDIVVASAYGLGVIADAYNFAYLFTGNILILFGGLGGPFHSSTVSIMTGKKDDRESGVLITQIMIFTFVALSLITLVMYFAAPYLVEMLKGVYAKMSTGTIKAEFEQQTLTQLRIMLPLIIISGLVGISYGVLNVYNRVVSASLSPAVASLAIIVAIGISQMQHGEATGAALAVGTLIGAIGQLLVQLPPLSQLNLHWKVSTEKQSGFDDYGKMVWPALFSTSVGQLTVYVDAYFALQETAVWSAIVNSNRLVQLPLGILLTAMLVPILPRFTQHVEADRIEGLKDEIRKSLRFLWFLALPISAIFLAIGQPIIQALFQRGQFSQADSMLTNTALMFLVPSIFFYVARDLLTRVFYAYKDSETPYRIALIAIFVKAGLDWMLVQIMPRAAGISLATSIMTIFNLTLLTWALKKKTGNLGFTQLTAPLTIMILGTIFCGAATWAAYAGLEQIAQANNTWLRLLYVSISSGVGLLLYVALCIAFKLEEPVAVAKRLPVLRNFVK